MIVPRACDLCLRSLPTELVQFEVVRGSLTSGPNLQWAIEPVSGGMRLTTICQPCSMYLQAGLAHLRDQHARWQDSLDAQAS